MNWWQHSSHNLFTPFLLYSHFGDCKIKIFNIQTSLQLGWFFIELWLRRCRQKSLVEASLVLLLFHLPGMSSSSHFCPLESHTVMMMLFGVGLSLSTVMLLGGIVPRELRGTSFITHKSWRIHGSPMPGMKWMSQQSQA